MDVIPNSKNIMINELVGFEVAHKKSKDTIVDLIIKISIESNRVKEC